VARRIVAMLERVMDEIGDPKQKRMSNALRQEIEETLRFAVEHGLGA
jgi:hypothetical protein